MCFGCLRNRIINGSWTNDEETCKMYSKLSDKAGSSDENLVDELVLKELYCEDNIKYRKEDVIVNITEENKYKDLPYLYCDIRATITYLVLGHTIGTEKTKEMYKDDLAIKVIKQIEEDFESHDDKLDDNLVVPYVYFYSITEPNSGIDKKYVTSKALSYIIIYEIVSYFQLYDLISREHFFNRPFVKYVMEGKENKTELDEYWIEKINNKWDKKEEMNSKK
jgi:hypothetical protein